MIMQKGGRLSISISLHKKGFIQHWFYFRAKEGWPYCFNDQSDTHARTWGRRLWKLWDDEAVQQPETQVCWHSKRNCK